MRTPKKVTPRKAAANKRNAARSNGPKSERGKFFASRNAVTHGIFAPGMLLPVRTKRNSISYGTRELAPIAPSIPANSTASKVLSGMRCVRRGVGWRKPEWSPSS